MLSPVDFISGPNALLTLWNFTERETFEIAIAETTRDLEIQLNKRKSEMQTY